MRSRCAKVHNDSVVYAVAEHIVRAKRVINAISPVPCLLRTTVCPAWPCLPSKCCADSRLHPRAPRLGRRARGACPRHQFRPCRRCTTYLSFVLRERGSATPDEHPLRLADERHRQHPAGKSVCLCDRRDGICPERARRSGDQPARQQREHGSGWPTRIPPGSCTSSPSRSWRPTTP